MYLASTLLLSPLNLRVLSIHLKQRKLLGKDMILFLMVKQIGCSLLFLHILWRTEVREPQDKAIVLLQNALFHLLYIKLAVRWQMVKRCCYRFCTLQLWMAGLAMFSWGFSWHDIHSPKKTQSLLQKLSKSLMWYAPVIVTGLWQLLLK